MHLGTEHSFLTWDTWKEGHKTLAARSLASLAYTAATKKERQSGAKEMVRTNSRIVLWPVWLMDALTCTPHTYTQRKDVNRTLQEGLC